MIGPRGHLGLKNKLKKIRGNGLIAGSIVDTLDNTTKLTGDLATHNAYIKIRKENFEPLITF